MIPDDGVQILFDVCKHRGWDVRQPQKIMVDGVFRAFKPSSNTDTVLVSAPVGTGKTLGYLCGVIPYGNVVISTSTKALQEQIVREELPELVRNLKDLYGVTKTFYLLKGKDNYVCLPLAKEWLVKQKQGLFQDNKQVVELVERIVEECEENLKQNLPSHDQEKLLDQLPVDVRFEISHKNPAAAHFAQQEDVRDPYIMAKENASVTDILVINTALLSSEVWSKSKVKRKLELEFLRDRVVVVDEAHHAHEIAIKSGSLDDPTPVFERSGVKRMKELVEDFRQGVHEFHRASKKDRRRASIATPLMDIINALTKESSTPKGEKKYKTLAALDAAQNFMSAMFETTVVGGTQTPTYQINTDDHGGVAATMIYADEFRSKMSSLCCGKFESRVVFCSGSIGDCDVRGIGVRGERVAKIVVPSPFDFSRCKLFLPSSKEFDPTKPKWDQASLFAIKKLVEASEGRALILSTSRRKIDDYAKAVKPLGFTVITQNDPLTRAEMIEKFSEDEHSILIGTKSFWEGLDVPGESLQLVVMDKIMFPIMGDPVFQSMSFAAIRRGENPFQSVQVNYARQMMTQGAGRLMRSLKDKGGIAILDSRIMSKRYGRQVLGLVDANMMCTNDLDAYCDWMRIVTSWDGETLPLRKPKGMWMPLAFAL